MIAARAMSKIGATGVKFLSASFFFQKMPEIKVWYQLYGQDGTPYRSCSPTTTTVAENAIVDDFKKAVLVVNKDGFPNGVLASQFKVYLRRSNDSASEKVDLENHTLLSAGKQVEGLGKEFGSSLIVVIPFQRADA